MLATAERPRSGRRREKHKVFLSVWSNQQARHPCGEARQGAGTLTRTKMGSDGGTLGSSRSRYLKVKFFVTSKMKMAPCVPV